MPHILIIKTSSMGDIIHTLPALTDAAHAIPNLQVDWVVEEAFAEIPSLHSTVQRVIPIALRRWRKSGLNKTTWSELKAFLRSLRERRYDAIIDAQGLLKSAVISRLAKGPRHGFNSTSAREPLSVLGYQHTHRSSWQQHAVERNRQLLAAALKYPVPTTPVDYDIRARLQHLIETEPTAPQQLPPYLVFLHNTTWDTKLYPEAYWKQLGLWANQQGLRVILPSGNDAEKARADRIAHSLNNAEALPRLSIRTIAEWLLHAQGVISVDTGFAHLAAALAIPNICLFGPTDPTLSRPYGPNQHVLSAHFPCAPCLRKTCNHPDRQQALTPPCFKTIPPEQVWRTFLSL